MILSTIQLWATALLIFVLFFAAVAAAFYVFGWLMDEDPAIEEDCNDPQNL